MGVRPTGGPTMGRPVPKPAAQSPVAIGPGTAPTAQRTAREQAAKGIATNLAPRPTQPIDNYAKQDTGPKATVAASNRFAPRGAPIAKRPASAPQSADSLKANQAPQNTPQTQQQPGAQAQQVTTAPRVQSKMGSSANINTPVPGKQGSPSGPAPERPSVAVGSSGNDTISKSPAAAPARSAATAPRPRPQARARPAAPAKETTGDIMNRMWVKESFESFLRNNFLKG